MSEINDIKELTEGICLINFKSTIEYQHKYPRLMAKYIRLVYTNIVILVKEVIKILTL